MCHALASVVPSASSWRVRRRARRARGDDIEQPAIGGVATEAQRELGDGRGAGEPSEIARELGARQRDVEAAQRVEVAARLRVELGAALREEIERAAEAAGRAPRALGEHAADPRVARDDPQDARRLQVVERMEDDRFGREQRHA